MGLHGDRASMVGGVFGWWGITRRAGLGRWRAVPARLVGVFVFSLGFPYVPLAIEIIMIVLLSFFTIVPVKEF